MRVATGGQFLSLLLALVLAGVAWAGCAQEEFPSSPLAVESTPEAGAGDAAPPGPQYCTQSRAESLPARLLAISAQATENSQVVLVSDLFNMFQTACGLCHGSLSSMGGFQIAKVSDFTLSYIQSENVVSHMTSNLQCPVALDPNNVNEPMPPCGQPNATPYSMRSANDEIRQFAELLQQWIAVGGPASFMPGSGQDDAGADGGSAPSAYAMTPASGDAMTNIGNCIPSKAMVGVEETKSAALDAVFAAAKSVPGGNAAQILGLPEKLSDTDLFTLDSATLAKYGVVAYAPGYPLWSDNAGKLRFIRVPRGTSVQFDKTTQQFQIPPNTRFYKTFMKQIVDTDGSYRYRKIETRLIVSRPDGTNGDGTAKVTALFGTYRWRDDESDADLVETLLHDGTPFPDTELTYNVDEPLAADLLLAQPADPEIALENGGAIRHYEIPSSQRCVQCHMGSPSADFVLGFTPLQINRRPTGVGGTLEAAGPDELTQLQRFIDYGVITGIGSAADVLPLEQSQGSRTPRNQQELVAQGYMLGNCAHCHNPRGYPTSIQPLLKDLLDFLPSASSGGVFQFPLERYSPDIFRGALGNTAIPFITPSLMDLPRQDITGVNQPDLFIAANTNIGDPGATINYAALGPWRSLIYRNVQSAFTYEDDLALFPHMPMNTPGFDPRVRTIFADWMVSIPAVRKAAQTPEYAYFSGSFTIANSTVPGYLPDTNSQPYVEVPPGDPRYADAVAAASERLDALHTGVTPELPPVQTPYVAYSDPGDTSDTVDPAVELDPTCHPTPDTGIKVGNVGIPVPYAEHPHWVVTDLSTPAGAYTPRRSDWASYLVSGKTPPTPQSCDAAAGGVQSAYQDQLDVIASDQTVTLDTNFRSFATTPRPMGLWQQKPGCDFSGQKTVQDYTGASRAHWMGYSNPPSIAAPPASAPVYEETPGAEVFKMICINCHGKKADSNGFIAQNLSLVTGGLARVADFRDGLFGPVISPGGNLDLAFGLAALPPGASSGWSSVTDDDRGARYMAWMALGGTEVQIPQKVLQIVGVTPVFGVARQLSANSANMLAAAKALCASFLGPSNSAGVQFATNKPFLDQQQGMDPSLLYQSGDAELWLKMCALENPPPVHVIKGDPTQQPNVPLANGNSGITFGDLGTSRFEDRDTYLADLAGSGGVGNELGTETPASALSDIDNWPLWPWCIDWGPSGPPNPLPSFAAGAVSCPAPTHARMLACNTNGDTVGGCFDEAAANKWAVRGAMNAGFSVFLYLKNLETLSAPPPDYNQCEQLP